MAFDFLLYLFAVTLTDFFCSEHSAHKEYCLLFIHYSVFPIVSSTLFDIYFRLAYGT